MRAASKLAREARAKANLAGPGDQVARRLAKIAEKEKERASAELKRVRKEWKERKATPDPKTAEERLFELAKLNVKSTAEI